MKACISRTAFVLALACAAAPAAAQEPLKLERLDAETVALLRDGEGPVSIWLSADTALDSADRLIVADSTDDRVQIAASSAQRNYVLVQSADGDVRVAGERVLPLEQGSNFRDIGGYATADGRVVRWGKAFRSGAMPLLTEADYALLEQLDLGAVVDLRSLEERELAPDQIDDRTGALFLSNDYSLMPLMAAYGQGDGENTYAGLQLHIAPQLRAMFNRLLADDGAVLYHCSAGQDRTGVATALIYDVLGVDRETIVNDYHLSTSLRRTEFEMPEIDPADHPGNPMLRYYVRDEDGRAPAANPLYTPSGASHLVQFFAFIDQTYGGTEAYLDEVLGITAEDVARLREIMLD